MRRVFTLPEGEDSTLLRLDREISGSVLDFLKERIVAGDIVPHNLEQGFLDTAIPQEPTWVADHVDYLLDNVVSQSVHTSSPRFVGHMTSAIPYFMVPLAKLVVALNQNVVKIETSKAFTPLERQTVGMLHRLVYEQDEAFYQRWTQDFAHSLGVFCSGGTLANVTALWVARNRLLGPKPGFEGVAARGIVAAARAHGYDDLAVVVSRRGHYSLRKATDVLGLGRENLVTVDIGADHRIELDALRRTLDDLRARRVGVVAVVGVAGATETGSVDPLVGMAEIARARGVHFHVDAAWGGPTLFSRRHRGLLAGIEQADSVTLDAHKQLYVPMGAGVCLFRDVEALDAVQLTAQYIIRKGSRDIGKHTLEGSRPGVCLLVHAGLRIIGRRGYELLIDHGIELAASFAGLVDASEDFERVTAPELNLLTYRYVPPKVRAALAVVDAERRVALNAVLSELTEAVQKRQRRAGHSFVSRTRLEAAAHGGDVVTVLRVVLANPLTTVEILREILDEQREHARVLLEAEGYGARLAALLD